KRGAGSAGRRRCRGRRGGVGGSWSPNRGAAAVHHGLLLGGLTVPKGVLQAMFRTYPNKIKKERLQARLHGRTGYRKRPPLNHIGGEDLNARLRDLGFEPAYLE